MVNIHGMELHEEVSPNHQHRIVRVPGGWIYYSDNEQAGGHWQTTSTFVPFNNEFMPKDK
jgi:hypothetical protein